MVLQYCFGIIAIFGQGGEAMKATNIRAFEGVGFGVMTRRSGLLSS